MGEMDVNLLYWPRTNSCAHTHTHKCMLNAQSQTYVCTHACTHTEVYVAVSTYTKFFNKVIRSYIFLQLLNLYPQSTLSTVHDTNTFIDNYIMYVINE